MYDILTFFVRKSYNMINLNHNYVEVEITKAIGQISSKLKIDAIIDSQSCPGDLIKSQVLLTIMGRLEISLGIKIPENCYIFFEKKTHKQLSIKEATQKLIKEAKNGN